MKRLSIWDCVMRQAEVKAKKSAPNGYASGSRIAVAGTGSSSSMLKVARNSAVAVAGTAAVPPEHNLWRLIRAHISAAERKARPWLLNTDEYRSSIRGCVHNMKLLQLFIQTDGVYSACALQPVVLATCVTCV
eukprot:gb/GECG01001770.1/.p1 GENE.gb/GECG01001770.1/~~gb/GECG01001770.1/.p1  ORF type:complete len:133 (+),score=8.92 gb/GECG01001770.1/:1-399(+)